MTDITDEGYETKEEAVSILKLLRAAYVEETACPLLNGQNCMASCVCLSKGTLVHRRDDSWGIPYKPNCLNVMLHGE